MSSSKPDRFIIDLVQRVLYPIVQNVRTSLGYEYDVKNGKYKDYCGLCDVASDMVIRDFNTYMTTYLRNIKYNIRTVHGEQQHTPRIPSYYWEYQHTWVELEIRGVTIHIDPTCSQFKFIYPDIPDYFVSIEPPKWYLKDSDSLIYGNGRYKKWENVKVPIRIHRDDEEKAVWKRICILEVLVYFVWGPISDLIHPVYKLFKGR